MLNALRKFCKICNREVVGGNNSFVKHTLGKEHISQLPSCITIKVPFHSQKIKGTHRYFGNFGTIIKHEETIEGNYITIDYYFEDPNVYTDILHREHWFCGLKVDIFWKKPPGAFEKYQTSILDSAKEGGTLSEQFEILQSKLQIANEVVEEDQNIIRTDLTQALASMFPFHQVHFIGASLTGLHCRDFDIYISNMIENDNPEVLTVNTIRMLIQVSEKFEILSEVEDVAIPIFKYIHTRTGITCNLTLTNKLSIANSNLIKYYLTMDEKIRPLVVIIKFWAECHCLKHVNLFSGYALCLMVIFFLQQEPYNLPSVNDLQKDCPSDMKDGWNCAFSTPQKEYPTLRDESLLNLVAGFFRFYSNFDYVTKAICPFLGTAVKKTGFLKPYDLPDSYIYYITQNKFIQLDSGFCIQDPFEHNRNVTCLVDLKHVGMFVILCKVAEQFFIQTENAMLSTIFMRSYGPPISNICFKVEKPEDGKSVQEWFNSLKIFTVKVLKEIVYGQVSELAEVEFVQVIDCECKLGIWDLRIHIMKTLQMLMPPGTNDLDVEFAILPHIQQNFPQILNRHFENPRFTLILTLRENPCRVEFGMQLRNMYHICYHIAHYLRLNFPYWMNIAGIGKNPQPDRNVEGSSKAEETSTVIPEANNDDCEIIKTDDKLNSDNGILSIDNFFDDQVENLPEDGEMTKTDDTSCIYDFLDGQVEKLPQDSEVTKTEDTSNSILCIDNFFDEQAEKSLDSPQSQPQEDTAIGDFIEVSETKKVLVEESELIEEGEIADDDTDEDDVPSDFFDDFANDDFIDGLDIVDVLDVKLDKPTEKKTKSRKSSEKRRRSKSRSPIRRRKRSRSRSRDRERSGSKESRESVRHSKGKRRRRSSSMETTDSERESRTRSKRKRSRSRSRSRDSSLGRKSDRPKRKTFLEEIIEKLNETTPAGQYNNSNSIIPYPPPIHLLPPPTQFFPVPTQNPVMQHFGEAYPINLNPIQSSNVLSTTSDVVLLPQVSNPPPRTLMSVQIEPEVDAVVQQNNASPKVSVDEETSSKAVVQKDNRTTVDIHKLYADKKISLYDFLTILAKRKAQSSVDPEDSQKKANVISRCEDAIKAMSEDCKFMVKSSSKVEDKPEVKYQSPLWKKTTVSFQYTSPATVSEEVDCFALALDQILERIGVVTEIVDVDDVLEILMEDTTNFSFVDKATIALSLQASLLKSKTVCSCEECSNRKLKVFSDVCVQVSEEELNPTNGLLNDSITPLSVQKQNGKQVEASSRTPVVQKIPVLGNKSEAKKEKRRRNRRNRKPVQQFLYSSGHLNTFGSGMTAHPIPPCLNGLPSIETSSPTLEIRPSLPPGPLPTIVESAETANPPMQESPAQGSVPNEVSGIQAQPTPTTSGNLVPRRYFTKDELRALRPPSYPSDRSVHVRLTLPDGRRERLRIPPDPPPTAPLT